MCEIDNHFLQHQQHSQIHVKPASRRPSRPPAAPTVTAAVVEAAEQAEQAETPETAALAELQLMQVAPELYLMSEAETETFTPVAETLTAETADMVGMLTAETAET